MFEAPKQIAMTCPPINLGTCILFCCEDLSDYNNKKRVRSHGCEVVKASSDSPMQILWTKSALNYGVRSDRILLTATFNVSWFLTCLIKLSVMESCSTVLPVVNLTSVKRKSDQKVVGESLVSI